MKLLKSRGRLTTGRRTTENVRHHWVHSMHCCSCFQHIVTVFTGRSTRSREQHEETGKSRRKHDFEDLIKVMKWFDQHDIFCLKTTKIYSLSTGVTATEGDSIT